jgi:hypothetical protein
MLIVIIISFLIVTYLTSISMYWNLVKAYQKDVDIEYRTDIFNLIIMILPIINSIYCLILYFQIKENNEL